MLRNIPPASQGYARQMLILLCTAWRPLTVPELIEGIAVEICDTPVINARRRVKNFDATQEVCPGFVELETHYDNDDDSLTYTTARIGHFSVQGFLESDRIGRHEGVAQFRIQEREAHQELACICLTYLLQPQMSNYKNRAAIKKNCPLAAYAAEYWAEHLREGKEDPLGRAQAVRLLEDVNGSFTAWRTLQRAQYMDSSKRPSPLYYSIEFGLSLTASTLIDMACNQATFPNTLDAIGGAYGTALQAAASGGFEKIVQLLLDKKAYASTQAELYGTALQAALSNGHEKVVRMLLTQGAGTSVVQKDGRTPLMIEAAGKDAKQVQLLLECPEINITIRDRCGRTALFHAARCGRVDAVQLLLSKDPAAQYTKDCYNATPLFAATRNGHDKVVRLLVKTDNACLSSLDGFGRNVLWWAAGSGNAQLIQVLERYAKEKSLQFGDHSYKWESGGRPHQSVWKWCRIRTRFISLGGDVYICDQCDGGYFSICGDCARSGMMCHDESHVWRPASVII